MRLKWQLTKNYGNYNENPLRVYTINHKKRVRVSEMILIFIVLLKILYNNKMQLRTQTLALLLFFALFFATKSHECQHDELSRNTTKHYLNDLTDGRLLQGTDNGKLRIYVDYTQVTVGGDTEINTIKRILNISASYFYNVLNVTRLPRLYFPKATSLTCNSLSIPSKYVTDGTIGDLGIVCGNQKNQGAVYVAKSTPCAFLESNKRPIWGIIIFNNVYLKFDQEGFQQMLYVGLHELTHVLGFSASMYETYPNGNPLVSTPDGNYFLNSPKLQAEIKNFYNCSGAKGLPLEDQDGTLIASHWEKKVVGNQYMIASNKKNTYMSRFTLALLESSGFYTSVNYNYAEPSSWGKNKGCSFLNIDDCNYDEFCSDKNFSCDSDATGIGRCGVDPFTGACMVPKYFTNTICVDESYQLKNLNAQLNTLERGGSSSRCFDSDFRQDGLAKNSLNNRCYVSVCSATGKFLYILVGSYVLICRTEGQIVNAPPGLTGTLTCPKKFNKYCENKKTCPYHCNKNGACINGQCLCTGITDISQSCIDVSILLAPVGSTGGLLNALDDQIGALVDLNGTFSSTSALQRRYIASYSINKKCIQGTAFDQIFGECLKCSDIYNCQNCNETGCISCDNGKPPVNNKC